MESKPPVLAGPTEAAANRSVRLPEAPPAKLAAVVAGSSGDAGETLPNLADLRTKLVAAKLPVLVKLRLINKSLVLTSRVIAVVTTNWTVDWANATGMLVRSARLKSIR